MQCAGKGEGETECMSGKLVAAEAGSGKGRKMEGDDADNSRGLGTDC